MTLSTRTRSKNHRSRVTLPQIRWKWAAPMSFFIIALGCDHELKSDEPRQQVEGHGGDIIIILKPEPSPHPDTGCIHLDRMICDSYEPLEGCVCHDDAPSPYELCDDPGDFTCHHVAIVPDHHGSEIPSADCYCSADAPRDPEDCESAVDFRCVNPKDQSGCRCEAGSPERPEDCATPESFFCQNYEPRRIGCSCEGRTEEECSVSSHMTMFCASEEPTFGCSCFYVGH